MSLFCILWSVRHVLLLASFYRASALVFPQSEYNALYDLFNATNGAEWDWKKPYATNGDPWTFATQVNPCTSNWQGIICTIESGAYHISQLVLDSYGLRGTIPNSIADFQQLQVLDLFQNHVLTGTIPSSMGSLSNLRHLELSKNNFRGHIPTSFAQLHQLLSFQVDSNDLFGPFPECLCSLIQLESLTATSNHFIGTIPACLGNLQNLQVLSLDNNLMNGTIPSSLGNMSQLVRLSMQGMYLSGTIPATIGNMSHLQWVYLSYNQLTGAIPTSMYYLTNLYSIGITDNALSGSISESIAQLNQLHTLTLEYNYFTNTIPNQLFTIESLLEVTLDWNALTGTIPENIGRLPMLGSLALSSNRLTGTVPASLWNMSTLAKLLLSNNSLWGPLPSYATPTNLLNYMDLSNNLLSGSIPNAIEVFTEIYQFSLSGNHLTGTIPPALGSMKSIEELDLSHNALSGTLPSTIQKLADLTTLSLQDNRLIGALYNFINTTQTSLNSIQLDSNQFTGELPPVLFELPSLISLSIVGSCLHGTLPNNICNASHLEALILQGLTTGASCRTATESLHQSATFGGTIPSCLLSMPTLQTLLLSSNSLKGSLKADDSKVGDTLIQLDLSHNLLTGSIPVYIQNHTWSLLDLSHNKFSGVLNTNLRTPRLSVILGNTTSASAYPKLALDTNRLSGPVPNSVKQLQSNLSVLAGNLFQCRYDKTDLPQHDSDIETYECASNSFDLSVYLWIGALVCSTILMYVYLRAYPEIRSTLSQSYPDMWLSKLPALVSVSTVHSNINNVALYATIFCVVILLPYYAIISHYSGTHTHQYAYVLSAIYTSGVASFTITFILLAILLVLVWWLFNQQLVGKAEPAIEVKHLTNNFNRRYMLVCAVYALVNICFVLGVNIAFVYIVLYQSSNAQTVAQVALSVFKLGWSMEVSPYMMRKLDAYYLPDSSIQVDKHLHNYFTLQLLVALFNNIAIPCLVVMAIDPNCFSEILLPPSSEMVNYIQPVCERNLFRGACVRQSYRVATLQYTPPFTYSYQCSASFITSYAPAFIYMSISNAILHPMLQYVLVRLHGYAQGENVLHKLTSRLLPRMLKAPTTEALHLCLKNKRSLVGATGVLVTLFTQLGILLTFGAIFPPVALAMAVSIAAIVYLTRFKVQRFVQAAVDAQLLGYLDVINAECAGVGTREQMQLAVKIIVWYCCAFYTLFLFDTLGDSEGFAASAWVFIVVPLSPLICFAVSEGYTTMIVVHKAPISSSQTVNEVELGDITDGDTESSPVMVAVENALHQRAVY